jgi:hypothetical protein
LNLKKTARGSIDSRALFVSFSSFAGSLLLYPFAMKTLLRSLLYLSLVVWLGAEVFFPVVAAITFQTLQPDTHKAGTIVGELLRILHGMGLVSGMVALALLALAPAWAIYKPRTVLAPMAAVVLMIGATVYAQFVIIPAMDRDRDAAGGAINTFDTGNPLTVDFNKLHNRSVDVEGLVSLLGIATVVLVARAESVKN